MPVPTATRTAVNQPPNGGSDYPFTENMSSNLAEMVQDLYLSYQDDAGDFRLPFAVTYLRKFGTDPVGPGGIHDYEIRIHDADSNPVFLSEDAESFSQTAWGTNRHVLQWILGESVLKVVYSDEFAADYSGDLTVADGVLDPRTCNRLPGRVRSITVGNTVLTGPIKFRAGYNLAITPEALTRNEGGRTGTALLMEAIPGAGLGRRPGCEEIDDAIYTINKIPPAPGGLFRFEADDCFRLRRPVEVTGGVDEIRTAGFALNGYTNHQARSMLVLEDHCTPCCECQDYVNTYYGLRRVWNMWQENATILESARDTLAADADRWNAAVSCGAVNPGRIVAVAMPECRLFVGASFCNTTQCCLGEHELWITLQFYRQGVLATWPGAVVLEAFRESGGTGGEASYSPLVGGTNGALFRFVMPYLEAGQTSVAKMKICVKGCEIGDSVVATLSVYAPSSVGGCAVPTVDPPSVSVQAEWGDETPPAVSPVTVTSASAPLSTQPPKRVCVEC